MKELINQENEVIERNGFGYSPEIDYGEDTHEIEELNENIKKTKFLVKEILTGWDKSTNNDVLLYFEFLRTKYPEIIVTSSSDFVIFKFPKKLVKYFNSPESVTRARRILNNQGIGLPTNPLVFKRRMKRQKLMRRYFQDGS